MYKVYFLRVTTGEVGSAVDARAVSWDIQLNDTESFSVTVGKDKLARTPRLWWAPWSGGVLITYTSPDGVERPVVAGPVVDWGKEDAETLELTCEGIRAIFRGRTVWRTLEYRGLSYGAIAWELCKHAMDKPGGALPIYHASPYEQATRERTYEGWNLANNQVDKRWEELSNVIAGPDIMIRPEWANPQKTRVKWGFYHGTHDWPFIAQAWTPDFDTTAPVSDIGDPQIISTGAHLVSRVWYTGAGEGEGIVRVYAENLRSVAEGVPFLEDVLSDSDQDKPEPLQAKADGALKARTAMLDQVTFTLQANSRKTPLGSFFVGDICRVTLAEWLSIPGGSYDMRLIKMSGSLDGSVTLDFQEASW
ncbi:hypothetical protein [Rothia nasimurium]|uniref:hypothetical protein n=1 Tax=Rothia nasimurium TaxID=85336 RepID=UPI001F2C93F4|nr:hypothetical protein [Rothia nasimurium]